MSMPSFTQTLETNVVMGIFFTNMRLLFLLTLLFSSQASTGQNPVCTVLTNQNGLPSNTVYCVMQDQKGYLWLGHDRGLCRYDGVKFNKYKASMLQGYSLSNLMQTENGEVWAQDFSGNFYHTSSDSLIIEQSFSIPGAYSTAGIIKGQLLISVKEDSIRVLHTYTKQRTSIAYPGKYSAAVYYDAQQLYFISGQILYQFDGIQLKKIETLDKALSAIYFLQKTSFGFLAFSKTGTPNVYIIKNNRVDAKQLLQSNTFIQEVNVWNNEYWISTTAGAYCFSEYLAPLYNGHCFFNSSSISRIAKDREGSYWFGTLNKGLIAVANIKSRLYPFNNESITALAKKDEQTLLTGTSGHQLLAFDTKKNDYRKLYQTPTNHEVINILHDDVANETFLCSDRITYLKQFALQQQFVVAAKQIVPLGANWYVYAYAHGVGFFNSQQPSSTQLPTAYQHFMPAATSRDRGRWVLFNNASSTLITATSAGMFYFTPSASGSLQYKYKPVFASSLLQVGAEVFITTYNQGVLVMDSAYTIRPLTQQYTTSSIYKLQVSGQNVWMLGDEMVLKYNRKLKAMNVYSVADGLPKAEYKDMRWMNGQLYLATSQGLAQLDATTPSTNTIAPLMAINHIFINGAAVAWQKKFELASNQNNLSIGFSVLAYKNINEQSLAYRINNQPWQPLENGVRNLYLSALAPGQYTVQLQAKNEDGLACVTPLSISFTILMPIYRQLWFLILLSMLAITTVFIYFKLKLQKTKKENLLKTQKMEMEQELQRSKLASIKSQMNPHFFFNALNTIQSYIYSNDKLEAANYLNQFSDLTRMILDMSNKDLISLSDELKALKLYLELEALRFEEKLYFTLDVAENVPVDFHWLPPMLIQPYIENAIKHGLLHSKNNWQLLIKFSLGTNGLIVVIDDNGVGRKKSNQLNAHRYRQHQPFAMSANEKRLEILNKGLNNVISIQIKDKYDALDIALGTTVILHVPAADRQWKKI